MTNEAAEQKLKRFIINKRITVGSRITGILFICFILSLLLNIAALFQGNASDNAVSYDPSDVSGARSVYADIASAPAEIAPSSAEWLGWYTAETAAGEYILMQMDPTDSAALERQILSEGPVRVYGTAFPLSESETDFLSDSIGISAEQLGEQFGGSALICSPGGQDEGFSAHAGRILSVLMFGLILLPLLIRQFRVYRRCRHILDLSIKRLRERGALTRAVSELESDSGTVFGDGYRSGKYRTVLTEHYIFGGRMFSAADLDDLLWYYYQPGKLKNSISAGYLIAYGADRTGSYCFFLGTDAPEAAAKQLTQIIAERNPSAVYGAENKDKYLALIGQTS